MTQTLAEEVKKLEEFKEWAYGFYRSDADPMLDPSTETLKKRAQGERALMLRTERALELADTEIVSLKNIIRAHESRCRSIRSMLDSHFIEQGE